VHALHEKYGPVVRLGPRHLSYTDPRAWKDIFGHRAGDHISLKENPKSDMFYRRQLIDRDGMDAPNILDADREEHGRLRRAVAAGFSDRSMREHEGVIVRCVNQLMRGLHRRTEMGEEVDMVKWYNWTTFDVIGDLVFAESFGCLEDEKTHPFVDMVTGSTSEAAAFVAMKYAGLGKVPGFKWALNKVIKFAAWDSFKQMMIMMSNKLQHRLDMGQERNDLFEGLMSKREEWNLDLQRLQSNATIIAAAGSETTASLLAGVTFHLLKNPDKLKKLNDEVRSAFKTSDDITIAAVNRLPYLLACLNEGLRRYPPAVSNLPRDVHEGGEMIAGEWVSENTIVEIQQYAINHNSQHWSDPFAFKPERWLNKIDADLGEAKERDEKDIDGDRLEAMQTFSVGPRNCVGRK
jgi:cytochrome P450